MQGLVPRTRFDLFKQLPCLIVLLLVLLLLTTHHCELLGLVILGALQLDQLLAELLVLSDEVLDGTHDDVGGLVQRAQCHRLHVEALDCCGLARSAADRVEKK